jgi:hypothetical protein
MELKKTFVIIGVDEVRTEKTFYKFKQANLKVKVAHNKSQIDDIFRTGGIQALLISPQVIGDVEKLNSLYNAPIFVIGDIEPHQISILYKENIIDLLPTEFRLNTLIEKLGVELLETLPVTPTVKRNLFADEETESRKERVKPKKSGFFSNLKPIIKQRGK